MRNIAGIILIFAGLQLFSQDNYSFLKKIRLTKYYSGDVPFTDTVPVPVNGYFELKWQEAVLLQGRIFKNTDGTQLVAIMGIHSDQQCSFHHLYFFEYSPETDSLKELLAGNVFAEPHINKLLIPDGPRSVFKKYISAYNKDRTEPQTVDWLLDQVYSLEHLLSSKNKLLTVTLHVCDVELSYIPAEMTAAENKIIVTGFKKAAYKYNPVKKIFVLSQ